MKKLFVISAALLSLSTSAYGACVETFGIGSRATALGGAYAATADDPFAVYYNPAGLTRLDGPMLSMGANLLDPNLKVHKYSVSNKDNGYYSDGTQTFGPKNFNDSSDDLIVPHAGFAMPAGDQLAFGVAAYLPWGLMLDWPSSGSKNPGAYNFYSSWYIREVVTPSVAYKINDQFSVGFGVSIGKSKSGSERVMYFPQSGADFKSQITVGALAKAMRSQNSGLSQADAISQATKTLIANNGTLPAPYSSVLAPAIQTAMAQVDALHSYNGQKFKADMTDDMNYSFNVGVMYEPTNNLSLGLTYRSKAEAEFDGTIKFNGKYYGKITMDYDHPDQLQVGVRYRPHDKISVEADVVWTYWRDLENQEEIFSPALLFGSVPTKKLDRQWNNTNQIRLGLEWYALDFLTVRTGYFYDPSPIPNGTFDMMWPDADRKTYSLGFGFNFDDSWTVDTTLQYAIAETSRVVGGNSHNLNDSYNPLLDKVGLDNGARNVTLEADGHLWGYSATVNYKF